jgi:hypothetical protein
MTTSTSDSQTDDGRSPHHERERPSLISVMAIKQSVRKDLSQRERQQLRTAAQQQREPLALLVALQRSASPVVADLTLP